MIGGAPRGPAMRGDGGAREGLGALFVGNFGLSTSGENIALLRHSTGPVVGQISAHPAFPAASIRPGWLTESVTCSEHGVGNRERLTGFLKIVYPDNVRAGENGCDVRSHRR